MKIKKTNGQHVDLKLKNFLADKNTLSKSKFQNRIKQQLMVEYPYDLLYEEVRIPGENLILDFFIPSVKLVIECHGRQHTAHVKFFHRTKRDFHQQQIRDERKKAWCRVNGFKLVEVFDDSSGKT